MDIVFRAVAKKQTFNLLITQKEHQNAFSWNKVTPQLKDLYRYLETSKINYSRPR